MANSAPGTQQVDGGSSMDNSQSSSESNPLPPTMNNQLPTINKHGLLPRLGPKQLIVLLAIVAILLVIGFFVFDKDLKLGGKKQGGSDKVLLLIKDVKFATDEAKSKEFFEIVKTSYEQNEDNYRSTLIYILYTCQSQKLSEEDRANLREAYDEILAKIDKSKPEATNSPYIWYCE